jgi:RNA polymerase sigma factor (sigma-70 family)
MATLSDSSPSGSIPVLYPSPQDILEAEDAQTILADAIARLKPRERELFEMRQLEGLTLDEITAQTGIQKPSVKSMISTARKKLLTELKQRLRQ